MKLLIIVRSSPWGSSRTSAAVRLATAWLGRSDGRVAVYFRDDGVYNVLPGTASDGGLDSPQIRWRELARNPSVDLVLCPAAVARRLPADVPGEPRGFFRQAGLPEMLSQLRESDRVVCF